MGLEFIEAPGGAQVWNVWAEGTLLGWIAHNKNRGQFVFVPKSPSVLDLVELQDIVRFLQGTPL